MGVGGGRHGLWFCIPTRHQMPRPLLEKILGPEIKEGAATFLGYCLCIFFLSNRKKEPPLLCVYSSVYPETHLVAHAVLELTWTSCLNLLGTEFIGMHHIAQVRGEKYVHQIMRVCVFHMYE